MTKVNIGPNSYMVLVKAADCGTGAGGFKPGNDCASGREGGSDSSNPRPDKIATVDINGYTYGQLRDLGFENDVDDDEFYYHVTTTEAADAIANDGLVAGKESVFSNYANYSSDRVFFSERSGVSYWAGKVEDHLFHNYDNPPNIAITRFSKDSVDPDDVEVDEVGGEDSGAGSYFMQQKNLQVLVSKAGDCGQVDDGTFGPGNDCAAGRGGSSDKPKGAPGKDEDKQKEQQEKPEFKEWFGQSKVVDESGNPLVVYHGTDSEFEEFRTDILAEGWGRGAYLTSSEEVASEFGDKVVPAYVRIENPYRGDYIPEDKIRATPTGQRIVQEQSEDWGPGEDYTDFEYLYSEPTEEFGQILQELGYDGVISRGSNNMPSDVDEIVVFDPNQIKSPTGNTGDFSRDSDNINKSYRVMVKVGDCGQVDDGTFGPGNDCAAGRGGAPEKPKKEKTVAEYNSETYDNRRKAIGEGKDHFLDADGNRVDIVDYKNRYESDTFIKLDQEEYPGDAGEGDIAADLDDLRNSGDINVIERDSSDYEDSQASMIYSTTQGADVINDMAATGERDSWKALEKTELGENLENTSLAFSEFESITGSDTTGWAEDELQYASSSLSESYREHGDFRDSDEWVESTHNPETRKWEQTGDNGIDGLAKKVQGAQEAWRDGVGSLDESLADLTGEYFYDDVTGDEFDRYSVERSIYNLESDMTDDFGLDRTDPDFKSMYAQKLETWEQEASTTFRRAQTYVQDTKGAIAKAYDDLDWTATQPVFPLEEGKTATVFRGIKVDSPETKKMFNNLLKSDKFKLRGYGSASFLPSVARNFSTGPVAVQLKINAEVGVDLSGASLVPGEQELLLPKNNTYTVVDRKLIWDGRQIILEVELEE